MLPGCGYNHSGDTVIDVWTLSLAPNRVDVDNTDADGRVCPPETMALKLASLNVGASLKSIL